MRLCPMIGVVLLVALSAVRAQDASHPWPTTQQTGVLLPDLTGEFERAWLEAQRRVAPGHRSLVRKAVKQRQKLRTVSRQPVKFYRPLGR